MKILIDECVQRKLKQNLSSHECQTVSDLGLAGTENGELLSLAEKRGFHILLTLDKGFACEQNLAGRTIAILILRAKSNRIEDLLPHVRACLAGISAIQPGHIEYIG